MKISALGVAILLLLVATPDAALAGTRIRVRFLVGDSPRAAVIPPGWKIRVVARTRQSNSEVLKRTILPTTTGTWEQDFPELNGQHSVTFAMVVPENGAERTINLARGSLVVDNGVTDYIVRTYSVVMKFNDPEYRPSEVLVIDPAAGPMVTNRRPVSPRRVETVTESHTLSNVVDFPLAVVVSAPNCKPGRRQYFRVNFPTARYRPDQDRPLKEKECFQRLFMQVER